MPSIQRPNLRNKKKFLKLCRKYFDAEILNSKLFDAYYNSKRKEQLDFLKYHWNLLDIKVIGAFMLALKA